MSHSNILSSKLTSQNIKNHSYSGFLDKLILDGRSLEIHKDELKDHLDNLDIRYEDGSFRGGGLRLKVYDSEKSTSYIKYNYFTKQVSQLILNPSSCDTYSHFLKETLSLFAPIEVIEDLPITRLDKTVDITLSYEEVSRGFDVKYKRSANIYQFMSAQNRSIDIGKSPEVIKLYNRSFKANLNFPCTRLEICLIRNKLDFKNIRSLRQYWQSDDSLNDKSFINVSFNSTNIKHQSNKAKIKKQQKVSILLDHFPYFLIKSLLNGNGNFIRDFKGIVELIPFQIQPNEIFKIGMRNFFKDSDSEEY